MAVERHYGSDSLSPSIQRAFDVLPTGLHVDAR